MTGASSYEKKTPGIPDSPIIMDTTCTPYTTIILVASTKFLPMWQHRFDADPDPNWHQNDTGTDSHADPIPSFTHVGNQKFYFYFKSQFLPVNNIKCVIVFSTVLETSY
jgi:hypothetical protein